MRKMYKRILGFCLALLMLAVTACGAPEEYAQETSAGHEEYAQETSAGHEEYVPETSAGHEEYVPETSAGYEEYTLEASAGHETGADVSETEEFGENVPEAPREGPSEPQEAAEETELPTYGDYYYDLTNVVLYLEVYDELPPNYITKNEARELGWDGGSVEEYREGAAIGGDRFGNREGLLPKADGRSYTECDIDTDGYGSRGSRRLVFSNDGLYFYTSDHYETFSEVTVTEDYEVVW